MDDLRADFFNVYLCHVCQTKESFVNSKLCTSCKLISYCGKEHQKADWKNHKSICKTVQYLNRDDGGVPGGFDDVFNVALRAVDFTFFGEVKGVKHLKNKPLEEGKKRHQVKERLATMIQIFRGENLNRYELKMMFLPYHCAVCFTRDGIKKELVCTKCFGVNYCSTEHQSSHDHARLCSEFQRVLSMDFFLLKLEPESFTPNLIKPSKAIKLKLGEYDMKSFIAKYIRSGLTFEEEALKSIFLTGVLTFAHTIKRFPNFSFGHKLVIHIVGAHAQCEGDTLPNWENVFHFFPQVHTLLLVFISPCIDGDILGKHLCADCVRGNKTIRFLFHKQHYHEYHADSDFLKPDVIVAFNSGLYETYEEDMVHDTWGDSLPFFFKYNNVPVILTETHEWHIEREHKRLRPFIDACRKKVHFVINCEKNPYNNLRPWRDLDDADYRIRHKNSYVTAFVVESG